MKHKILLVSGRVTNVKRILTALFIPSSFASQKVAFYMSNMKNDGPCAQMLIAQQCERPTHLIKA